MKLRDGLPPLPARFRKLPMDERGYPVPWFVAKVDGKFDESAVQLGWQSRGLRDLDHEDLRALPG